MYTFNVRTAIVDDSANGKMTGSTEVGIAIALFCFLMLLLGFYIVSRPRPAPPAEQIARRWDENMWGRGRSARQHLHRDTHHQQTSEYCDLPLRRPASTLSFGSTVVEHQSSPEYTKFPSPPPPVYFSHHRAESQDIFGGERRRAL